MNWLRRVGLILLWVASLSILLVPFYQRAWIEVAFVRASYWILWLLTALWVFYLLRAFGLDRLRRVGQALRRWWPIGVTIALVAAALFATNHPRLRILADEANHVSVSRSMAVEQRNDQVKQTLNIDGKLVRVQSMVPTRRLMFPFLAHVIHLTTGYRLENFFVLNFILLGVLLALGLALTGPLGVLFIAAQPLVILCATSGGYDLLFATMMVGLFALTLALVRKSEDQSRGDGTPMAALSDSTLFYAAWLHLIILAHTRHETFMLSLIGMGVLALFRLIPRGFRSSWILALTPLLLAPVAWQLPLVSKSALTHPPSIAAFFSLKDFVNSNTLFFKELTRFGSTQPFLVPLVIAGLVAALGLTVAALWRAKRERNWRPLAVPCMVFAMLVPHWIVITSYFWGQCTHPASARFYVLPVVVWMLCAAHALWILTARLRFVRWGMLVVATATLVFSLVTVSRAPLTDQLSVWRIYHTVTKWLALEPDSRFVVIADEPRRYMVSGNGAVSFGYANNQRHLDDLLEHVKQRRIRDVYVLQNFIGKSASPILNNTIRPKHGLETMYEGKISPTRRFRLSRLVPWSEKTALVAVALGTDPNKKVYLTQDVVTVFAAGDLMLAQEMHREEATGKVERMFGGVLPRLRGADVAFVNLESALSDRGVIVDKRDQQLPLYRGRPSMVRFLKEAGIDVVSHANDHSGDYGPLALEDSLSILRSRGIRVGGVGNGPVAARRPVYTRVRNLTIAWIAVDTRAESFAAKDGVVGSFFVPEKNLVKEIAPLIRDARNYADLVFVTPHWGENWIREPNEERRQVARALIDAGADAIFGHSSNIIHGVETYKERPIVYDMGSFLFDSIGDPRTRRSLFYELDMTSRGVHRVRAVPIRLGQRSVNLARGKDAQQIMSYFRRATRALQPDLQLHADGEALEFTLNPATFSRRRLPAGEPKASFDFSRAPKAKLTALPPGTPERHFGAFTNGVALVAAHWPETISSQAALPVRLYFRSERDQESIPVDVVLRLVARENDQPITKFTSSHEPGDWSSPMSSWKQGDLIEDTSLLGLSPSLPAGNYELYASLESWDPQGKVVIPAEPPNNTGLGIYLGNIRILEDKH